MAVSVKTYLQKQAVIRYDLMVILWWSVFQVLKNKQKGENKKLCYIFPSREKINISVYPCRLEILLNLLAYPVRIFSVHTHTNIYLPQKNIWRKSFYLPASHKYRTYLNFPWLPWNSIAWIKLIGLSNYFQGFTIKTVLTLVSVYTYPWLFPSDKIPNRFGRGKGGHWYKAFGTFPYCQ